MMAGSNIFNFTGRNKNRILQSSLSLQQQQKEQQQNTHHSTTTTLSSSNNNTMALGCSSSSSAPLPPESDLGNVEYKSQLINPTLSRLQHLSTQMKWRLCEGDGEAIYEIGVNDDGSFTGLSEHQMEASLETIQNMASCINAGVTVLNKRRIMFDRDKDGGEEEPKFSLELLVRKLPDSQLKANLRVAIIGSAQSGKSTLCGVLTQGKLDNGNGQARIAIFRHLHEFRSGKTSSICFDVVGFSREGELLNYKEHSLEELLEHSVKLLTLIDLAGDRRFLKTTIYGVSGYNPHYCALCVNARAGLASMTREHFGLAMALGIPLFIVLTKVDLVSQGQLDRVLDSVGKLLECTGQFKIARVGNKQDAEKFASTMPTLSSTIVPLFCISNVTGLHLDIFTHFLASLPQPECLPLLRNVLLPPPPVLDSSSSSSSQLNTADGEEEKPAMATSEPLFYVEELFRSERVGLIICGLLAEGKLAEGDRIKYGPDRYGLYSSATVESIHQNKQPVLSICAGDSASLLLSGPSRQLQMATLKKGMVLISSEAEEHFCWQFTSRFYLLYHPLNEICKGFQGTAYIGSLRRTVTIVDMDGPAICASRWLRVTFKFVQQPEFVRAGMPLIFRQGHTQAMGVVVDTNANASVEESIWSRTARAK